LKTSLLKKKGNNSVYPRKWSVTVDKEEEYSLHIQQVADVVASRVMYVQNLNLPVITLPSKDYMYEMPTVFSYMRYVNHKDSFYVEWSNP